MPNNPYGPPLIDFSGLDPIGSYEKGAAIRRQYTARSELAKCDQSDFQCMSRVLMQLDPAEGVRLAQLQNQLQHQTFQEDLATKQLAATEKLQGSLIESRQQRGGIQLEQAQAPFNAVRSSLRGYAEARPTLFGPGGAAALESGLGGPAIGAVRTLAGAVAEARRMKGQAAKEYVNDHTPGVLDFSRGTAAGKLAELERDAAAVGVSAEALGAGSATDYVLPPYEAPPKPPAPQAGHAAPSALRSAAAPPPPVTVSPPGGEAASAAEVQPHTVQTVPIQPPPSNLPKIKKGSPEEAEALKQARDKLAAHPNDPQVRAQVLQRLIDLGIGP